MSCLSDHLQSVTKMEIKKNELQSCLNLMKICLLQTQCTSSNIDQATSCFHHFQKTPKEKSSNSLIHIPNIHYLTAENRRLSTVSTTTGRSFLIHSRLSHHFQFPIASHSSNIVTVREMLNATSKGMSTHSISIINHC